MPKHSLCSNRALTYWPRLRYDQLNTVISRFSAFRISPGKGPNTSEPRQSYRGKPRQPADSWRLAARTVRRADRPRARAARLQRVAIEDRVEALEERRAEDDDRAPRGRHLGGRGGFQGCRRSPSPPPRGRARSTRRASPLRSPARGPRAPVGGNHESGPGPSRCAARPWGGFLEGRSKKTSLHLRFSALNASPSRGGLDVSL